MHKSDNLNAANISRASREYTDGPQTDGLWEKNETSIPIQCNSAPRSFSKRGEMWVSSVESAGTVSDSHVAQFQEIVRRYDRGHRGSNSPRLPLREKLIKKYRTGIGQEISPVSSVCVWIRQHGVFVQRPIG